MAPAPLMPKWWALPFKIRLTVSRGLPSQPVALKRANETSYFASPQRVKKREGPGRADAFRFVPQSRRTRVYKSTPWSPPVANWQSLVRGAPLALEMDPVLQSERARTH